LDVSLSGTNSPKKKLVIANRAASIIKKPIADEVQETANSAINDPTVQDLINKLKEENKSLKTKLKREEESRKHW
jgi:hypothetical protein